MKINQYNEPVYEWSDFILSLGMEACFGTCPIREQIVADKIGLGVNGD